MVTCPDRDGWEATPGVWFCPPVCPSCGAGDTWLYRCDDPDTGSEVDEYECMCGEAEAVFSEDTWRVRRVFPPSRRL